jgi:large subunit ribosomal protein L10
MNREEKSAAIEEIAAQIEGAEAIFAVDYRGISVAQAAELRAKLREADASFRVVKNRLTKLAADKAGEERLAELLTGPTALTFVRGDTALAAKTISNFNREHEVLAFKGGFMDGLSLDEDKFKSISRLPSRDVLNGQLAGVVASPLTGLVRGLGSMIQGLALQLGQIAEKGLVGGGAASAGTDQGSDASTAGPVAEDAPPANTPEEAPSTPPAEDAAEPEASAEEGDAPAESPEEAAETAESDSAEASDEVAGQDDKGSQGDGATADGGGSEAEQPADSSDKEKEE